jgi:2-C-methyl-D-erythritol 4-phosphate cytidylyltransferase
MLASSRAPTPSATARRQSAASVARPVASLITPIARAHGRAALRATAQAPAAPSVAAIASSRSSSSSGAKPPKPIGSRDRAPRLCPAAAAAATAAPPSTTDLPPGSVSVVLLSGGSGKRMGAPIPKQYLELRGRAIATHSMATFAAMPEVAEVVVVCDPAWRHVFEPVVAAELAPRSKRVAWALPGAERQDSVASGLAEVAPQAAIVAVHDSARPLVTADDAARCMRDAWACGAAVLGVPCKQTVKEVDAGTGLVARTLDRSLLWEVQTPQCVRPDLLRRGFAFVQEKGLAVTDDVSVVEALGEPVRITRGCYTNIKVTTPEDMGVAEGFIDERAAAEKKGKEGRAAATAAAAAAAAAA